MSFHFLFKCINRIILFVTKKKQSKPPGAVFNNLQHSSPCPHPADVQDWLQVPQFQSISHSPSDPCSLPMRMKFIFADEEREIQSQESHPKPLIRYFLIHFFRKHLLMQSECLLLGWGYKDKKKKKKHSTALRGPRSSPSTGFAVGREQQ